MEKILHADPEEICKKILATSNKITQAEYFPSVSSGRKVMSFIIRIGGHRYGGSIFGGLSKLDEKSHINSIVLMAEKYAKN